MPSCNHLFDKKRSLQDVSAIMMGNCSIAAPVNESHAYCMEVMAAGGGSQPEAEPYDYKGVSDLWCPITLMWIFKDEVDRNCIGFMINLPSGVSPGQTTGISIHAVGTSVKVTAFWPDGLLNEDNVFKYDDPKKIDKTTTNMLEALAKHMKSIKVFAENRKKAAVEYDLDFAVKETRDPPLKFVAINTTGLRWIRFYLESVKDPTYKKLRVTAEEVFED